MGQTGDDIASKDAAKKFEAASEGDAEEKAAEAPVADGAEIIEDEAVEVTEEATE